MQEKEIASETSSIHNTADIQAAKIILNTEQFFLNIYLFIYFWLCWVFIAAHGLSLVAVHGFLTVVASLVVEHGL